MDERVSRAGLLYERAVFTGEAGPLAEADRELDAAEADLAVARGRLTHMPRSPSRIGSHAM